MIVLQTDSAGNQFIYHDKDCIAHCTSMDDDVWSYLVKSLYRFPYYHSINEDEVVIDIPLSEARRIIEMHITMDKDLSVK